RATREQALADTAEELARIFLDAEANAQRLRASAIDLDSVEAGLMRARSAEQAAEKQVNTLRETIAGLNSEIRARADDAVEEKWFETRDKRAAASARVLGFEREVAVLDLLAKTLDA